MTTPAVARVLERLEGVRPNAAGWSARCPAHQDRSASLSVAAGEDGRALVHCFAGCGVQAIAQGAGLRVGDLFAGPRPAPTFARPLTDPEWAFRVAYAQLRREQAQHDRHRETWDLAEDIRTADLAVAAIRAWVTAQQDPECEACWDLLELAASWEREARRLEL